jgi:hypothetical protein
MPITNRGQAIAFTAPHFVAITGLCGDCAAEI